MKNAQIELLIPIFGNFVAVNQRKLDAYLSSNNLVISIFEDNCTSNKQRLIYLMRSILIQFDLILEEVKKLNKKESFLFNPLKFFHIGENMHSTLIANMLLPNSNHGQGNLFLKLFLNKLNIEVHESDIWIVTAEIGRIDILIKRINPYTVIIIENKSNDAIDQRNQIYRYWHQEIYLPNKNNLIPIELNNQHIIYLTSSKWKVPERHSLEKPKHFCNSLPEIVPITPKIWSFEIEIKEWLSNSINQLHPDNHRLREYIKQYLELWKK